MSEIIICIENYKHLLKIVEYSAVWMFCCVKSLLYCVTPRSHLLQSRPRGKGHVGQEGGHPCRCSVWCSVSCSCQPEHILRWGRIDQHHWNLFDLHNQYTSHCSSIFQYTLLIIQYNDCIKQDSLSTSLCKNVKNHLLISILCHEGSQCLKYWINIVRKFCLCKKLL